MSSVCSSWSADGIAGEAQVGVHEGPGLRFRVRQRRTGL